MLYFKIKFSFNSIFSDIRNLTAGTLSQRITSQLMSLKGLNKHLQDIRNYLEKVAMGKLPVNHTIIYHLQDVFNLLPDLNVAEFVKATSVKTNDQMLVIYTASIVRVIIALHNLINNKVANRDAEREEGGKKEDKIKEKDKDKDTKEDGKDKSSSKKEEASKKEAK
jgi:26S proteasome regulatory subunit N8